MFEDVPGAYYSSDYTNTQMQAWNLTKTHIILQKHTAGRPAAYECRSSKSSKEVGMNQKSKGDFAYCLNCLKRTSSPCFLEFAHGRSWQIDSWWPRWLRGGGHNYQLMDFAQRRISNFEVAHDQAMGKRNLNDWRARDSRWLNVRWITINLSWSQSV